MLLDQIANAPTLGRLGISVGTNNQWSGRYASQSNDDSDANDANHKTQGYGWNARVPYAKNWIDPHIGILQGGRLLRNGIIKPVFMHRDETIVETGVSLAWL